MCMGLSKDGQWWEGEDHQGSFQSVLSMITSQLFAKHQVMEGHGTSDHIAVWYQQKQLSDVLVPARRSLSFQFP